jgi:hypothetical protein
MALMFWLVIAFAVAVDIWLALIFFPGIWRSLRRHRPRVSR